MTLVAKHTSFPMPKVFLTNFNNDYRDIEIALIPGSPLELLGALMNDSDLRARIFERSPHFGGSLYEREPPYMLPRSDCSVFTHMDIAPRNTMVDEGDKVTGLLDWEYAGLYPDYWVYATCF